MSDEYYIKVFKKVVIFALKFKSRQFTKKKKMRKNRPKQMNNKKRGSTTKVVMICVFTQNSLAI